MKRSIVLFICALVLLTSCGARSVDEHEYSNPDSNYAYDNGSDNSKDTKKAETSSTSNSGKEKKKTEPFVVYEDDEVIINFREINKDGVVFDVDNLTDANLTIQADAISVNGYSTDRIIMSDDVAPQSIGKVVARVYDSEILEVEEVNRITGQFRVIDFSNDWKTYEALFEVNLNEAEGYYEAEYNLTLLYTDDSVDLYYLGIDESGVYLVARNKADRVLAFQADSISINRRSVNDIIMSDSVSPHSVGIIVADCTVEYEGPVETVGGQLRIIDFSNNWDTYEATFVNVEVKE